MGTIEPEFSAVDFLTTIYPALVFALIAGIVILIILCMKK